MGRASMACVHQPIRMVPNMGLAGIVHTSEGPRQLPAKEQALDQDQTSLANREDTSLLFTLHWRNGWRPKLAIGSAIASAIRTTATGFLEILLEPREH